MTHIDIVGDIALDNNQYFMDWFKTHWVTIRGFFFFWHFLCHSPGLTNRNSILQRNALPWITKIYGIFELQVSLNNITLDANCIFTKVFNLWGQKDASISPSPFLFAFAIFLVQVIVFYKENCTSLIETSHIPPHTLRSLVAY